MISSLCFAAPAEAGTGRIFTSVNLAFRSSLQPSEAARMARGGVRTLRLSFDWFGVEARQGVYDWTTIDRLVGTAASQGIRVQPVLFGTPQWAVPDLPPNPVGAGPSTPGDTAYPPVMNPGAAVGWRLFVQAAVQRYGARGSYWRDVYPLTHPGARPLPVKTWQVWNEPTIPGAFWPRPNVRRYGLLVEITSPVIRAVNPAARIALAGVPGHTRYRGITFINRLYRDFPHLTRDFDLVAFHPYSPNARDAVAQLGQLRRALRRDGDPRVPVWVSEIGWGSGHGDRLSKGVRGQARMLRDLFTRLARDRRRLRLWEVTWFDWRDPRKPSQLCPWCTRAGLIDWRNRRKPAWTAYRSFMGRAG